jgi:hypothetical protein
MAKTKKPKLDITAPTDPPTPRTKESKAHEVAAVAVWQAFRRLVRIDLWHTDAGEGESHDVGKTVVGINWGHRLTLDQLRALEKVLRRI